jgi:hypothetical protein
MLRVMVKLVWECQQAACVRSNRYKSILLLVITGIQGNAGALARKGMNSPFFSPKPAISVSPYGGGSRLSG